MLKILSTLSTLLLWILISISNVSAQVDCSQVTSLIKQNKITQAKRFIIQNSNHLLCSFHLAWFLRHKPEKARIYISQIKDRLDPQEDFYYKAIYLKLLLIKDFTTAELTQNFNILKAGKAQLANKLLQTRKKQFQAHLTQLKKKPFDITPMTTTGFWWAQFPHIKSQVDELSSIITNLIGLNQSILTQYQHIDTQLERLSHITPLTKNDIQCRTHLQEYKQCLAGKDSFCQQLMRAQTHLGHWNLQDLQIHAKKILVNSAQNILIDMNHHFKKKTPAKIAYTAVHKLFNDNTAILTYLSEQEHAELIARIDTLKQIIATTDWIEIVALGKTFQFKEITEARQCLEDQATLINA
ncbi:MAG: hypothetical protein KAH77_01705, partial [Thiomargarita sp.]|nr:hypothetical protein [Thiomargarita sp.]